jgi:hypothetical protein
MKGQDSAVIKYIYLPILAGTSVARFLSAALSPQGFAR